MPGKFVLNRLHLSHPFAGEAAARGELGDVFEVMILPARVNDSATRRPLCSGGLATVCKR